MTVLLIGLSHKTTPVDLREKFYISASQITPALQTLSQLGTIGECAMLSTCNRMEIYMTTDDEIEAERAIRRFLCELTGVDQTVLDGLLYVHQGRLAAQHLMRVACGLDSMILGESQILGQVTDAQQVASSARTIGTTLDRMMMHAIHAGKRARTETAVSQYTTSVSHTAARMIERQTGRLHGTQLLVIGAGEMAQLAAEAAAARGFQEIAIVNRTYQHAQELAARVGGIAYEWSRLWELLATVDAVITATGAPHTVLYAADIERVVARREKRELLMVDIALPRDIDQAVRGLPGIICYDIDDLQRVVDEHLIQREQCIPAVEAIIAAEEEKFNEWYHSRRMVPVIAGLRRKIHEMAEEEVRQALNRLDHLEERDQETVTRLAHRIVNKMLHEPTTRLRQHAANGDGDHYMLAVRDLFALDETEEAPLQEVPRNA